MNETLAPLGHNREILAQVPKTMDLGFFPVGLATPWLLELTNYEDTKKKFKFSECIFAIEPTKGALLPKTTTPVRIVVKHQFAKAVVTKTTLSVQGEGSSLIKLSAIFKLAHLTLEKHKLDFGTVLPEEVREAALSVQNPSEVIANFCLRPVEPPSEFLPCPITCLDAKGFLPPNGRGTLRFRFAPLLASHSFLTCFELLVNGLSSQRIEVRGQTHRLSLTLDKSRVDFGCIKRDVTVKAQIDIRNNCRVPLVFDILGLSPTFQADKLSGTISALSHTKVTLLFSPKTVGIYSSVLSVLVRNLDVASLFVTGSVGTSSNIRLFQAKRSLPNLVLPQQALALHKEQIESLLNSKNKTSAQNKWLFQHKASVPLHFPGVRPANQTVAVNSKPKDDPNLRHASLSQIRKETDKIAIRQNPHNVAENLQALKTISSIKTPALSDNHLWADRSQDVCKNAEAQLLQQKALKTLQELFRGFNTQKNGLEVSENCLNFGENESEHSRILQKSVILRNHSSIKGVWVLPLIQEKFFEVSSALIQLSPGEQTELAVTFRPDVSNKLFSGLLCLYHTEHPVFQASNVTSLNAEVESMNASALITSASLPPNEFQISLSGSSYSPSATPPFPLLHFSAENNLYFPSSKSEEEAFQVLTVHNASESQALIRIKSLRAPFSALQTSLAIPKGSIRSFLLRFHPQKQGEYHGNLDLAINERFKKRLGLKGVCHNDFLRLDPGPVLAFEPLFLGVRRKTNW